MSEPGCSATGPAWPTRSMRMCSKTPEIPPGMLLAYTMRKASHAQQPIRPVSDAVRRNAGLRCYQHRRDRAGLLQRYRAGSLQELRKLSPCRRNRADVAAHLRRSEALGEVDSRKSLSRANAALAFGRSA